MEEGLPGVNRKTCRCGQVVVVVVVVISTCRDFVKQWLQNRVALIIWNVCVQARGSNTANIMASEAEISQQDKPVYKKIIEYKKKISLVEGKRRAMFNKFEQEKSVNREKEKELDVELKVPQFNFFTFFFN